MKTKFKFVITAFVFFWTGMIFKSCKKYPENRLWFTRPENIFTGGKITSFTVDGADSIPLINSTWGYDITAKSFSLCSPSYDNLRWVIGGDFDGKAIFNGDKEFSFYILPLNILMQAYPAYLPFSVQKESEGKSDNRWEILKCTRKNKTLKLQRKVYGKTYIVQFN